jgi:hypothetical protein
MNYRNTYETWWIKKILCEILFLNNYFFYRIDLICINFFKKKFFKNKMPNKFLKNLYKKKDLQNSWSKLWDCDELIKKTNIITKLFFYKKTMYNDKIIKENKEKKESLTLLTLKTHDSYH